MRLSEFRALMRAQFGPHRAASVAADHVCTGLAGLTPDAALQAGVPARRVWLAVCDEFDVPEPLRHGLPD